MKRTRQEIHDVMQNLKEYLLRKADAEDWHRVADAAMDMRELVVELKFSETEDAIKT